MEAIHLIAYSIALAKMTAGVDRVIVSTDSLEYAKIAEKYGAEVPFLRPKALSQDTSTDFDFMSHTVNWFDDNSNRYSRLLDSPSTYNTT